MTSPVERISYDSIGGGLLHTHHYDAAKSDDRQLDSGAPVSSLLHVYSVRIPVASISLFGLYMPATVTLLWRGIS